MSSNKLKTGRLERISGKILIIIGFLVWFPLLVILRSHPDGEVYPFLILGNVVALSILWLGGYLNYKGKQYAAKITAKIVLEDSIPDILYLRSFRADISIDNYAGRFSNPKTALGQLVTEEEHLSRALRPFGSLVAIGKPGETLPIPGAARMYASDNWKDVIISQMVKAKLVIIRAEEQGEGFFWEIDQAFKILPKNKILIYIFMERKNYDAFREKINKITTILLPEKEGSRFNKMLGFIRFSENGQPEFLKIKAPILRFSAYSPFKFALKPVYEEYGIKWEKPPVSIIMVIVLLLVFGIVIGVITAIIIDFFQPLNLPKKI